MKAIFFICILIITGMVPGIAQPQGLADSSNSRFLTLVNIQSSSNLKEIHVGDKVKLKLTDATKVKGIIMRIDSVSFTVSNKRVRYDEIMKISTKQSWVRGIGFGLIAVGTSLTWMDGTETSINHYYGFEDSSSEFIIPGLIATGAGVLMVLPNYHDMGKHRLVVMGASQKIPLAGRSTLENAPGKVADSSEPMR